MSKDSIQWELLVKHFNDPQDTLLAQEVAAWRNESPDNQSTYEELSRLWNFSGEISILDSIDLKNEVNSLVEKLPASDIIAEEQPPVSGRSSRKWMWAAAVLLIVGATIAWWTLEMNKVKYLDKLTDATTADTLLLSDSSRIYMDHNSHVRYLDRWTGQSRTVFMERGNAFFDIAPDPAPFIVKVGTSSITVLGTSFNIRLQGHTLNLSVKTGKVRFDTPNQETILNAGMGMSYNTTTDSISTFDAVNTNEDAWITRELIFVDASLTEVCKKMETFYNVKIRFKGDVPLRKLNATFKNNRLEEVLEILEAAYPVKVIQQGNDITIKSK